MPSLGGVAPTVRMGRSFNHKFLHFLDQRRSAQFQRLGGLTDHAVRFRQCRLDQDNLDIAEMASQIDALEIAEPVCIMGRMGKGGSLLSVMMSTPPRPCEASSASISSARSGAFMRSRFSRTCVAVIGWLGNITIARSRTFEAHALPGQG